MDAREEALATRRLKIELEHADLLEKRNALYVLEGVLPIAFFTIAIELKYITIGNVAIFVIAAFLIAFSLYVFVEGYNDQLSKKRKELDQLATELLKPLVKNEPKELDRTESPLP